MSYHKVIFDRRSKRYLWAIAKAQGRRCASSRPNPAGECPLHISLTGRFIIALAGIRWSTLKAARTGSGPSLEAPRLCACASQNSDPPFSSRISSHHRTGAASSSPTHPTLTFELFLRLEGGEQPLFPPHRCWTRMNLCHSYLC